MRTRPRVEVLTFAGCPNGEPAVALVERISAELGIEAVLDSIEVSDARQATELRFLGSPSIRVDDWDIEPGAEERGDYVLACRVYPSSSGLRGLPDERWLRDALQAQTPRNRSRRPR